jgi:hypothetical protein
MFHNISTDDFAHHVRQATGWNDLGIRCGLQRDRFGAVCDNRMMSMLRKKIQNMGLTTDHFYMQKLKISDDDFKTIIKESYSMYQIMRTFRHKHVGGSEKNILKRIEDLDIDISHFKKRQIRTKSGGKLDAIDDETFKTLVKDNRTWGDLTVACGFHSYGGKKLLISRIEKLGLSTNHYDTQKTPTDKIFVVDSKYQFTAGIKKRLLRDFDVSYECSKCKNEDFTKRDGVLMWKDQEIVLQLEHKNGIHSDNRLDNLEFLCPNCHSQTKTYCGRNNKKRRATQAWVEDGKKKVNVFF